jgi:hypothetical protein
MMRQTGNVVRIEEANVHTAFWSENMQEESHVGDLGVDGKVITKYVLMKQGVK